MSELSIKLVSIEKDLNKVAVTFTTPVGAKFTKNPSDTTGTAVTTTTGAVTTTGGAVATTTGAVTTSGSAVTTNSAVTTTDSAVTTSGPAIKNPRAFAVSTAGKLKALSNRLTSVEKSLKAFSGKVDTSTKVQYKSLIEKVAQIKAEIRRLTVLLRNYK